MIYMLEIDGLYQLYPGKMDLSYDTPIYLYIYIYIPGQTSRVRPPPASKPCEAGGALESWDSSCEGHHFRFLFFFCAQNNDKDG